MHRFLIYSNIVLAILLCAAFWYGQTQAIGEASVARAEDIAQRHSADLATEVLRRIETRLRAEHLAKFLSSFDHPDPMRRIHLVGLQEITFQSYSPLLRELRLPAVQTMRLTELLSRRETDTKFYINPPPDVAEAGVPTSISFGAADIEVQIEAEFGEAILEQIKKYDADLPVLREQKEMFEVLACIGWHPDPESASKIAATLRENPPPVDPTNNRDVGATVEYYRKRLERMDRILSGMPPSLSKDAKNLLHEYLLEKEEASLDINTLRTVTVPKPGEKGTL